MNTDLVSELRTAIAQLPARVPPGLASSAYRRYRRRRITTRAVTAAATVVVTGAIAAVVLSGSPAPVVPDAQAGYVANRVTEALGALSSRTIMFEHITYRSRPVDPTQPPQDQWILGSRIRVITLTPSGRPQTDFGDSAGPRTETQVNVGYQKRTWWRLARPELPTPPPAPVSYSCSDINFNTQPSSAPEMAAQIRTEVACGLLKAAGTGVVDGVWTVELTGVSAGLRETYWIDTTTYLPVRIVTTDVEDGVSGLQADVRWLPPTAANLAKLTVPIPAGFTEVPAPSGGG